MQSIKKKCKKGSGSIETKQKLDQLWIGFATTTIFIVIFTSFLFPSFYVTTFIAIISLNYKENYRFE